MWPSSWPAVKQTPLPKPVCLAFLSIDLHVQVASTVAEGHRLADGAIASCIWISSPARVDVDLVCPVPSVSTPGPTEARRRNVAHGGRMGRRGVRGIDGMVIVTDFSDTAAQVVAGVAVAGSGGWDRANLLTDRR